MPSPCHRAMPDIWLRNLVVTFNRFCHHPHRDQACSIHSPSRLPHTSSHGSRCTVSVVRSMLGVCLIAGLLYSLHKVCRPSTAEPILKSSKCTHFPNLPHKAMALEIREDMLQGPASEKLDKTRPRRTWTKYGSDLPKPTVK